MLCFKSEIKRQFWWSNYCEQEYQSSWNFNEL